MKSEKVWTSLLSAFPLLLFTFAAQAELVAFRDYDAKTGTFTNAVRKCTLVTSATQTMTSGWYAVRGTVVCATSRAPEVWGDVHFVLCDGASYTVEKAEERSSGISVISNNFFTVYGQTEGTGRLWVKGGPSGAGIGGEGGTVAFPAVGKPSDAAGFFRIGVDATKENAK